MKRFKKFSKRLFYFLILLIAFIYLNNSSLLSKENNKAPLLLAHRGMAQTFPMSGITGETCTAERIYKPEHSFLENTIPSMEAAFKSGAEIVEFDIQPTTDGNIAVFHDWTLDCRTDGKGITREKTMAELKQLDIGFGYTADKGKTYPFRGQGVGLIPSLDEVFDYFPEQEFLIHVKSNDPEEGKLLAQALTKLPDKRLSHLTVYGGDEPVEAVKEKLPHLRVMSKSTMKSCLIPYMAVGWTGYVPSACERTQLHIPETIAPWLWGWPNKFLNRMEAADTRVMVVAGDGGWSEGFDNAKDLKRLPPHYSGGIWTNRIDKIGPIFQK